MPSDRPRLFIALWPDPALRRALAEQRDRWRWPAAARPVPDDKLHLTLHFIGALQRERLPALGAALAGVELQPTAFVLDRAALWGSGIASLEPSAPVPALAELQAAIGDALRGCAIEPEARAWRPHVTLARRARGAHKPAGPCAVEWPVDGFELMLSRLGAAGGYAVLERYPRTSATGFAPKSSRSR